MDETATNDARRQTELNNVTFALVVLPKERALLRRARRLVGNDADARDLVQETLERALRTFHAFRPGTAVWAWLRTIMNSVWIDGWRRRQAASKVNALPLAVELAAPDELSPPEDRTDAILEYLPVAIRRLPPIFRDVLELRLLSNWSYGAIADQLGIPARTVGTRILRARRHLRAILEADLGLVERDGARGRTERRLPAAVKGHMADRLMDRLPVGADALDDDGDDAPGVAEKQRLWHRATL
jgi:RNA polymerase sigma-70 factor (ECF subfamily)